MRRAVLAFCAGAYLLLTTGLANAAQGVCTCDDMAQIQRRIDETNVAIKAYYDLFAATPEHQLNTAAAHDKVQTAVGNAIQNTPTQLAGFFTTDSPAYTDVQCVTHFSEPTTSCVHEALATHERVHQTACEARTFRHPWIFLRDFIKEELDAYSAEREFLRVERAGLLCTCPYYALRVNAAGSTSIMVPFENIAGQDQLSGVKRPDVEIPLKFAQGGSVSGQTEAVISGHEIASGATECGISVSEPFTIVANGNSTPAPGHHSSVHVDLSAQNSKMTKNGGCTAPPPIGFVNVSGTTSNPSSPRYPFTLSALNSPDTISVPLAPGIAWTISTEMNVADPWPSVKASNGRGSPVGLALQELGMPDCTQ